MAFSTRRPLGLDPKVGSVRVKKPRQRRNMAAGGSSGAASNSAMRNKRAGAGPAFSNRNFSSRSVLPDHRAAPAIVDADRNHVGIAANAIGAEERAANDRGEGRAVVGDEEMIPF